MKRTSCLSKSHRFILVVALTFTSIETFGAPVHAQVLDFWNTGCLKAYKKWKTLPTHKAFAVSNSNAGGGTGQACGYSWSAPSKSAAEKVAVNSCEREKSYRSGKCYLTKSE